MASDGSAGLAWVFDIGSTFTKLAVIDLGKERLVASASAPTTVDTDVLLGVRNVIEKASRDGGVRFEDAELSLACSSAAGGLSMAVVGLVPELTVEAARLAVLGAGARVAAAFAYELTPEEQRSLEEAEPDIVLLTGGTDGGQRRALLRNAEILAQLGMRVPVIVAGNKDVGFEAAETLRTHGHRDVEVVPNVLPSVDEMNVEPVRRAIREMFLRRITRAKGIDRAEALIGGGVVMPTPAAVLRAARVIADGLSGVAGLGELVVCEVGGATTNVHSIAKGAPTGAGVVWRGLPEPREKRTVEGDLGVRWNAPGILEVLGEERLSAVGGSTFEDVGERVDLLRAHPAVLPDDETGRRFDEALAASAIGLALTRHSGSLDETYTPNGRVMIQHGKDLTNIGVLIGTGGALIHSHRRKMVLDSALEQCDDPLILTPRHPKCFVDSRYLLYTVGLMADTAWAHAALRVFLQNLQEVG